MKAKVKLAKWHRCSECNKLRNIKTFSLFNKKYKYFLCKICDAQQWKDAYNSQEKALSEQRDADNKVLEKIEKIVSKQIYNDILSYLDNCEYFSEFELTAKAYGEYQEEKECSFKGAYITQSCGMTGDDYSGVTYIEVAAEQYFKFSYHM